MKSLLSLGALLFLSKSLIQAESLLLTAEAFFSLPLAQARHQLIHDHCCIAQRDHHRVIEVCPFRGAILCVISPNVATISTTVSVGS